jgi:hypothetical protein
MHKRQEIKQAVVNILTAQVNGQFQTLAGSNVFKNRLIPLEETELPCICVYAVTETSEKFDNIRLKRTLDLAVDCVSTSKVSDDTSGGVFTHSGCNGRRKCKLDRIKTN